MTKKTKRILLTISIVLLFLFTFFLLTYSKEGIGEIVTFQGRLIFFLDKCNVDAECIAYVNGKSILTNPGMVRESSSGGLGECDIWTDDVGKMVEVRAIKTRFNSYTLVGDKSLYIHLIE